MTRLFLIAVLLVSGFGCGDDDVAPLDATTSDADLDASLRRDAQMDAATDGAADAANMDTSMMAGFATINGTCGRLAGEIDRDQPAYVEVHLDFADDPYDDGDLAKLTTGAQEILMEGTAGGSSGLSEAFAFEVLSRCEGAALLKSETEIRYMPMDSKKTDMLVEVMGDKVGVSVTRAVKFPPESPYLPEDGAFIEDKLDDILVASMNVVPEDAWQKQVLLIMAYGQMHADVIRNTWDSLDMTSRADTVVYTVVTDGEDTNLYFNRR